MKDKDEEKKVEASEKTREQSKRRTEEERFLAEWREKELLQQLAEGNFD